MWTLDLTPVPVLACYPPPYITSFQQLQLQQLCIGMNGGTVLVGRRVCVLTCTEQASLNDDKFKSTMLKIIPQYPSRPSGECFL